MTVGKYNFVIDAIHGEWSEWVAHAYLNAILIIVRPEQQHKIIIVVIIIHQHIINAVDCHRVKQRERAEASVQSGGSLWFCLHPDNVNVTDWTPALNVNCSLGSCENGISGNRNRKRLVSYWWYWCVANEWSGLTINPSLVTCTQ